MEDWLKRRKKKNRLISACYFDIFIKKKKERERRWNENVWKNKVVKPISDKIWAINSLK